MVSIGPKITSSPTISFQRDTYNGADPLLDSLKRLLSIDFSAHDSRLCECLTSARSRVEQATGLLLSPTTVTVQWRELYDYEPLPYGPVTGEVTTTGLDGTALTGFTFSGQFPDLVGDFAAGVQLSYKAGYNDQDSGSNDYCPMPLGLAEGVRQLAANYFDMGNRDWWSQVRPFMRYTWAS